MLGSEILTLNIEGSEYSDAQYLLRDQKTDIQLGSETSDSQYQETNSQYQGINKFRHSTQDQKI